MTLLLWRRYGYSKENHLNAGTDTGWLFVLSVYCFDGDTDTGKRTIRKQALILVNCSFYPSAALTKIQIQEREPQTQVLRLVDSSFYPSAALTKIQNENHPDVSRILLEFFVRPAVRSIPLQFWQRYGWRNENDPDASCIWSLRLLLCCFEEDTDRATRSTRTRVPHLICSFVYCTFCCSLIIGAHVYPSAALTKIFIRGIRTTRDASTAFCDLFVRPFRCTFYPSEACFGLKAIFTSIHTDHDSQIFFSPPPSLRIAMRFIFSLTPDVSLRKVRHTVSGFGVAKNAFAQELTTPRYAQRAVSRSVST